MIDAVVVAIGYDGMQIGALWLTLNLTHAPVCPSEGRAKVRKNSRLLHAEILLQSIRAHYSKQQ